MVLRPDPSRWWDAPPGAAVRHAAGIRRALLDTLQNWADYKQLTQRGYADRVVEIRLHDDEGGMNLGMPDDLVLRPLPEAPGR